MLHAVTTHVELPVESRVLFSQPDLKVTRPLRCSTVSLKGTGRVEPDQLQKTEQAARSGP